MDDEGAFHFHLLPLLFSFLYTKRVLETPRKAVAMHTHTTEYSTCSNVCLTLYFGFLARQKSIMRVSNSTTKVFRANTKFKTSRR